MNFRLIDVVRAHAGNYPRLHGLRTNLTGLTASVLCRFGARCRYTFRRQKRSLIIGLYVIELNAAKVGKESIEVIHSLFAPFWAQKIGLLAGSNFDSTAIGTGGTSAI
jgi:hypothetical protein